MEKMSARPDILIPAPLNWMLHQIDDCEMERVMTTHTTDELLRENEELRRRLEEVEAAIRALHAGEADYVEPNVVHRGMNLSDAAVKLFVVRIKPKDEPLVTEVPAPQQ